jgi:uncharacterized protein
MRYLLFFMLGQLIVFSVYSQDKKEPSVQVIARSFGDSIVLRWAPDSPMAWKKSLQSGFAVERYTIKGEKADKKNKPEKEVLTLEPLKPWELPSWEKLVKKNDYAAIAAQAIYGSSFEVTDKSSDVLQMVNKAKELENRFSFALFAADQSLEIAQASGLTFTDKNIKKGERYFYKIYSLVAQSDYKIDTGMVFIGADDNYALPKPYDLKAEFGDKIAMLSWNRVYYEHIYSGYFIERSDDNGKTYNRTHKLPIVNTSPSVDRKADNFYRIDSLPENNKKYIFRIKGVTPFEEIGIPSDTISGMGKASASHIAPHITGTENLADGTIKITWRSPIEYDKLIARFEVLRSDKASGDFSKIESLNGVERNYIDVKPKRVNYYIVSAIDVNGASLSSFPALGQLIDSIAPLAPKGLTAQVEKSGRYTLNWEQGTEDDILGYRVYMANELGAEFTQITQAPVSGTAFKDSLDLNTLTSKVYFKVMAMDISYNLSPMSEALEVKRPDIIPPVSPRFERYEALDSGIFMSWIPSTSEDVVKHNVYRRDKKTSNWQIIAQFDRQNNQNDFLDKNVQAGVAYQYVATALDDSGLESEKVQIITVSKVDYGFREGIKGLNAKVDRLKKEIELKWEFSGTAPEKILIYRASGENPLRLYKSVEGKQNKFIDKQLNMHTKYSYKIQLVYADGSASPLSKVKIIDF